MSGYNHEHEKKVADLRVELTKFINDQPEREITVWQQVLAETMLTMARWAVEVEDDANAH